MDTIKGAQDSKFRIMANLGVQTVPQIPKLKLSNVNIPSANNESMQLSKFDDDNEQLSHHNINVILTFIDDDPELIKDVHVTI